MPRDINDIYTLPAGNPVIPGTVIETDWANSTLNDIAQALTDSLDKSDPAQARDTLGLGSAAVEDVSTSATPDTVPVRDAQGNVAGLTSNVYGRKNLLINGDFSVWQRGASFSPAMGSSGVFTADRWRMLSGTGNTVSVSRLQPTNQPMVSQSPYVLGLTRSTVGSGSTAVRQRIENFRTAEKQRVCLSLYVLNATNSSKTIFVDMVYGDSANVSRQTVNVGNFSVPSAASTWTKITVKFTMPDPSSYGVVADGTDFVDLSLRINADQGIWNANEIRLHAIQLEVSDEATAFEALTPGQQFLDCARYYYEPINPATFAGRLFATGATATVFNRAHSFPTQMRVVPTATVTGAVYTNCSNIFIAPHKDGSFTRVDVSAAGVYQAVSYSLTFDSEL